MHDHLAILRAPTLCRENRETPSAGYLSTRGDGKLYSIGKVFQIEMLAIRKCEESTLIFKMGLISTEQLALLHLRL